MNEKKLNKKRTQVIRGNLSSMDDVLNTQQTRSYFSTIFQENQSFIKGNILKGALCYVKKE